MTYQLLMLGFITLGLVSFPLCGGKIERGLLTEEAKAAGGKAINQVDYLQLASLAQLNVRLDSGGRVLSATLLVGSRGAAEERGLTVNSYTTSGTSMLHGISKGSREAQKVCAHDLVRSLVGAWVVQELDRREVREKPLQSLVITSDCEVHGNGGCNGFTGRLEITATRLSFSDFSGTMRACPPALMDRERRYFELLLQVSEWRSERWDTLVLIGGERDLVLLKRQA